MTGSCEVRESSDDAAPLPVWSARRSTTFFYSNTPHLQFSPSFLLISVDYHLFLFSESAICHPNKHHESYLQCDHERPRRCDRRDSQAGNSQDDTGQTLDRCAP